MRATVLCASLAASILLSGCLAYRSSDDCDRPRPFRLRGAICTDDDQGVDQDDEAFEDEQPPSRDAGRDAGKLDASRVPFVDTDPTGDGPCMPGTQRRCQCASGAYSRQTCQTDESWPSCTCSPGLSFGDAGADSSTLPPLALNGPDCRTTVPPSTPRDGRWLAFRGRASNEPTFSTYLVEVGVDGPGAPISAGVRDPLARSLGSWSADGQRFAFDARSLSLDGPTEVQLVTLAPGSATIELTRPLGWLGRWAPTGSLFTVGDAADGITQFGVYDATPPARRVELVGGDRALPRDHVLWSPDARFVGFGAALAGGLALTDLRVPGGMLSVIDALAHDAKFSSDGRRIAYLRSAAGADELWVVEWNGSVQSQRLVASGLPEFRAADTLRWLDETRLLWLDENHHLQVSDVSGATPRTSEVGNIGSTYSVSPGGVCIVYDGSCVPGSRQGGTCVRKLSADAPAPVQLADRSPASAVWSQDGARLALGLVDSSLTAYTTDGQLLDPRTISPVSWGGLAEDMQLAWAPGSPARWLAFSELAALPSQERTVHLWSASSMARHVVDSGALRPRGFQWSADGRDLAVLAVSPEAELGSETLLVQRVGTEPLAAPWPVVGAKPASTGLPDDIFAFQP